MNSNPNIARWFAAVACLSEDAQRMADHIVVRARAAHRLGGTAEVYRVSAQELNRQADNAERLLFGQATEAFRAVAAESLLIAEAIEILGLRQGVQCRLPSGQH